VVNLWHGMPLKRIWRGLPNSLVPQCTWLLSTSPKYSEVQAEAAGFPVEKIPATGLPRNDLLFSRTRAALEFGRAARNGVDRVLLFLPTYRQSRTGFITDDGVEMGNTLGMTGDDVTALRNMLAHTGTRILVKPHPMSVHYGRDEKLDDRLWIISDTWLHQQGLTLYEALGQMDALITDVSSVYVDFLILRRPIFFYFPDLVEYRKSRSFQVEPVEDWLAGPLCTTAVQLRDELGAFAAGRDPYREKREKLAGILNPQTGPEATARLFALPGLEIE
jgi:CDP-glycerol glycerophosphotransferase (TagB/SpsB family)